MLLFVLGEAFFFDLKLVSFTSAGLLISTFISWIVNGEYLLPIKDDFYIANMTFRIICLFLTVMCINILTFFGGKFLVEELEKYVYHDPLTHLLTRRKLNTFLLEAYKNASKSGAPFSLLMMDIDDFKQVNDTYGHDCGDEILKYVAGAVNTGVKKEDKVFRWGGEEILALVFADRENAVAMAERIRSEVEKQTLNYRGEVSVSVTVTIGVSSFDPSLDLHTMMDDADKKLYEGKRNGKNRVVF